MARANQVASVPAFADRGHGTAKAEPRPDEGERQGSSGSPRRPEEDGAATFAANAATKKDTPLQAEMQAANPLVYVLERRQHCSLQTLHSSLASSCSSVQEQLLSYLQTNYGEISAIAEELEDADSELLPLLAPLSAYKLRAGSLSRQLNSQRSALLFLLEQKQRALSRRRHLRLLTQAYRTFRVTAADLLSLLGSSTKPSSEDPLRSLQNGDTSETPAAARLAPASETRGLSTVKEAREEQKEVAHDNEVKRARDQFRGLVKNVRQALEASEGLSSGGANDNASAASGEECLAVAASERAARAAAAAAAPPESENKFSFDKAALLETWKDCQFLPLLPMRAELLNRFVGLEAAAREFKRLEECLLAALPFFREGEKEVGAQGASAAPSADSPPQKSGAFVENATWLSLEEVESQMRQLLQAPEPSISASSMCEGAPEASPLPSCCVSGTSGSLEGSAFSVTGESTLCEVAERREVRQSSVAGRSAFRLPLRLAELAAAVQELRKALHARLLRELRDLLRALSLSAIEAQKRLRENSDAASNEGLSLSWVSAKRSGKDETTTTVTEHEEARRVVPAFRDQAHIEDEWCLALQHLIRPLLDETSIQRAAAAREEVENLFRSLFVDAVVADALAACQRQQSPAGRSHRTTSEAPARSEVHVYRAFLRALVASLSAPPGVFLWVARRLSEWQHSQRPCVSPLSFSFASSSTSASPLGSADSSDELKRVSRKSEAVSSPGVDAAKETNSRLPRSSPQTHFACCCCCEGEENGEATGVGREKQETKETPKKETQDGDLGTVPEAEPRRRSRKRKLWLLADVLAVRVLQTVDATFGRLFKPAFREMFLSVYVDTLEFFSALKWLMVPCEEARFRRLPAVKAFMARRSSLLLWATIFDGQQLDLLQRQLREDQQGEDTRSVGERDASNDARDGLDAYRKILYRDQTLWFPSSVLLLRLLRCRVDADNAMFCKPLPVLSDKGFHLASNLSPSSHLSSPPHPSLPEGDPVTVEDASVLHFSSVLEMQRASRLFGSQCLPQSLAFLLSSLSAYIRALPAIARRDNGAGPNQQSVHSSLPGSPAEEFDVTRGGPSPSLAACTRALLLISDVRVLSQSISPSPVPPVFLLCGSDSPGGYPEKSPSAYRRLLLDFPLPERNAPSLASGVSTPSQALRLGPVFQAALGELHRGVEAALPLGQCCVCMQAKKERFSGASSPPSSGTCAHRREKERKKLEEGNTLAATMWEIFQSAVELLATARARLEQQLLSHLQMISKGRLLPLRSIPAAYRMTQKQAPRCASPYIDRVLQPLLLFRSTVDAVLPGDAGRSVLRRVVTMVSSLWIEEVELLLQTEERKESALQRLQRGSVGSAQKQTGAGGTLTDFEKMKLQLFLDGQTLGEALLRQLAEEQPQSRLLRTHFSLLDKLGDNTQKSHSG
ncbi:hypothetical protein TGPRC2_273580 [Toxoplasma gondii TgCatPRC2]|uniref:COG complex component COG2 C-terminal domain-containing protein n=5 Tax=Toxoplasma gondii TaxID=5811 RepID=A0A125YM40_TOXGV|nr:hypothetical protein TGME49_273580 [Toxoplasma gondii ME49]EPT28668.1 hypothetical protein TGME49_273580 [Toxoplasma gondii ME49]ESS36011.1 hypothetical protein TGVEG_273580 [Toxoplasma gondii VEG]KYK71370.1 hypothetical protein TGPRC2_273580 [Toxoplasma gondii TgCatPRC2]|eukprot:XP_018636729.1 hypothetical protein TGME49_273580 [Toxoplasma gondii ME49]